MIRDIITSVVPFSMQVNIARVMKSPYLVTDTPMSHQAKIRIFRTMTFANFTYLMASLKLLTKNSEGSPLLAWRQHSWQSWTTTATMNIQRIRNMLLEDNSVETRREVAIRGLMVYLKEKEEELFKEE
ncbi:hypothetical protein L3Q82_009541, partial [Scortum barcoo]